MTEPIPTPATSRLRGPSAVRVLVVGVASVALAISAAIALAGASPALSPAGAVGPGAADANGFIGLAAETQDDPRVGLPGGPAMPGGPGARGGAQVRAITLTGKSGNDLSLRTEDAWTRTITVDADTTYTRAGQAITLNDLQVGDTIAFRQAKQPDGSFRIKEVHVILPHVAGQVTAVTDSSITVKLRDGSTKTITVNGSTKYTSGRTAATIADVKVDGYVAAEGIASGDTFTALAVAVFPGKGTGQPPQAGPNGKPIPNGLGRGRGGWGPGPQGPDKHEPGRGPTGSPAPSAPTSAS